MNSVDVARGRSLSDIVRLSAERNPDKLALAYEAHRDSFAQLNTVIDRTAHALIKRGVTKGDRVAILCHNNRTFVVLRFALARIGAITTPINFMLNAPDVAYILGHAEPVAFAVEDALIPIAEEAITQAGLSQVRRAAIPHTGAPIPEGWESTDTWLDDANTSPVHVDIGEDEPMQLMYTSGTESRPKGALLSTRALIAQYVSCIVDCEMDGDDITLHALPLYHCAQLDCQVSVDLYTGASGVLLRAPDPGIILETIEREKITKFFCPPTIWIALLRHPDFDTRDLSSLKKGVYGASIMPTPIIEELVQRLPGIRLYNAYGQTEMAPLATVLRPEDQLRKLGSAGKPCINVETRIVDDDDNTVVRGEVGEIVHRSPQAMLGYYKDPEKTEDAFRNGWFHSGDLGYMDEEGYLFVVDRKKDMIKSGGENVASREVEEVIFTHPAVAEVAVFGVPDDKWIEAVTAVIVLREGAVATVAELDAFCREELSGYKRPKHIHLIDALPKNASGKILKRDLRQEFAKA